MTTDWSVSLLASVERLHGSFTGGGDPLTPELENELRSSLLARLASWQPPAFAHVARYDNAVRDLVEAALAEGAPIPVPPGVNAQRIESLALTIERLGPDALRAALRIVVDRRKDP